MTPREERRYNDQFITRMKVLCNKTVPEDIVWLQVQKDNVIFRGRRLSEYSSPRKFENIMMLARPGQQLRFSYV